ncbi:winged helix-turn-helix domain-containing protein [Dyadobacter sp. 676]|uniref:Winged helix-turn-helix domain-containing protein n=1 Tax=Dyadobacter sp. 676 TaxID=3088362 RepID=A0AAU8FNX9_9BACT
MGDLKMGFQRLLLMIGLSGMISIAARANSDAVRFSENVNLALRRTVHLLLLANSDSTSKIEPVSQSDAGTFSVRINHALDYDKLPPLLQQSLEAYRIERPYNVALLDCETGTLRLGYQFFDLGRPGGVPCAGRAKDKSCYTLQIRFVPEAPRPTSNTWLLISFGGTLAALGFIAWNRSRHKNIQTPVQPVSGARLAFGHSWLDTGNQLLYNTEATQALTFREAKLLALFARNVNQVLERDFILKSVWEDEGVTVGRSVDVFVSRLRKLLAPDPLVKITAVHGIGYKMEVSS